MIERRRFLRGIATIVGGTAAGVGWARAAGAESSVVGDQEAVELSEWGVNTDEDVIQEVVPATPEDRVNIVFSRKPTWEEVEDIKAVIVQKSLDRGENPAQLLNLATCESRFDPTAVNRRTGALGLVQFMPDTWRKAAARYGDPSMNPFNPVHSIELFFFWRDVAGRRQWSC